MRSFYAATIIAAIAFAVDLYSENRMQSEAAPPSSSKSPLVLAILIITVGVGWLLTARGVGPGINWIWTLGLGVLGILTFVLSGGLDKLSVILGPFFLVGSVLSILRQTGRLHVDIELPVLVILIGALLLVAQMRFVPLPGWFVPEPGTRKFRDE